MFTLPSHYRVRGMKQKYLLKEVGREFLPAEIVDRSKVPFSSPIRAWIRGPLAGMVDDLLSAEGLQRRGLYDPVHVEKLIRRDRNGMEDNALTIWMLLTNELWFRTLFDRSH
jgi:asparagine synthase (glutamine-hydrolysing)